MSIRLQQKRREEIRRRISTVEQPYRMCVVLDCGRPTAAGAKAGLNRSYCRAHVEHFRRHGSYSKPSYSARELAQHRSRAAAWVESNRELPEVCEAIDRIRTLYWRGGQPEEAFRLTGKPPERRALICWARLRNHGVDPLQPLAAWLAVLLCHQSDPQPERKVEYRRVQGAKLVHRMSGGSHKRWERIDSLGRAEVTELHRYPASRGRVLRHLGEQLAHAAKPLETHLAAISALAVRRVRLPRAKAHART